MTHTRAKQPRSRRAAISVGSDAAVLTDNRLVTMVFDDEDEYVRFTKYVFDRFGGAGLALTNVPITASVRMRGWLWERTKDKFAMRPVSEEDLAQARKRVKGRRPFDPENLTDFRVPGIP